jgi:hypothetical protein
MVFSAARAWLQAMTPAAATQKLRNIIASPPSLFGESLLSDRAILFAEFWQSAIDVVDASTPLTIRPGDIPIGLTRKLP